MLSSVHVTAPAKINLHLKVGEKRRDGFHDIESIFQMIPLYDELLMEMVDSSYTCQVDSPALVLPPENTITSAYKAFCAVTGIDRGIKVSLTKRIPSGAGLGGGSSDAAAVLRGLERLFDVSLSEAQLHDAASKIGSDVFFFLADSPDKTVALVKGRGDVLSYIRPRGDLSFVLVCPGVHSSTAEAYSLVDNWNSGNTAVFLPYEKLEAEYRLSAQKWTFGNSFTKPLVRKFPVIGQAIDDLHAQNADFVEMTGSGSVVFGVFASEKDAERAYTQLCQVWKRCFLLTSSLFANCCSTCNFQEG